jgi:hypothetical protein
VAGPAVFAAAPVGNRAVVGRAPNAMATAHFFHWGAESSLTGTAPSLELERGGLNCSRGHATFP